MNYDKATELYVKLRQKKEQIEKEAKAEAAEIARQMVDLENWITLKAQEDGLQNVKTPHGTAYWSTHHSATVQSREAFFEFVKTNGLWDLLESRASKVAVKSYVEGHGEPPPGIKFASVKVFNLMANKE